MVVRGNPGTLVGRSVGADAPEVIAKYCCRALGSLGLSYRSRPNPALGLLKAQPGGTGRHSACPERHKAEGACFGSAALLLPARSDRSVSSVSEPLLILYVSLGGYVDKLAVPTDTIPCRHLCLARRARVDVTVRSRGSFITRFDARVAAQAICLQQ